MRYENVTEAVFLRRPNRFLAEVERSGRIEMVHVKNTGRCRELLIPGTKVWLTESANPARKTRFDLIAAQKGERLVNLDSQIPNAAAAEWLQRGGLFPDLTLLRREVRYGDSRFDLYAEHGGRRAFLEVKGVTLELDGTARFPDAPTERGMKHVEELIRCTEDGYEACLLFVIQMTGLRQFEPNWETHPAFGTALLRAKAAGVRLLAYDCLVQPDEISINCPVEIHLEAPRPARDAR